MMEIDERIIEQIKLLQKPGIIGVSGLGGVGKSTVAEALGKKTGIPVIGVDSFMKNRTNINYSNWDIVDFTRLKKEVLQPFLQGKNPIRYGHFDWNENKITEIREVPHNGYTIVEGVGLFRPNLVKYFTYKVWVDCSVEEGIARGKKRDREVYNNPQDESWDGIWKKNDEEYIKNFTPKELADVVIVN